MVAPFLLNGRLIMQEAGRLNTGWDEPIPQPLQQQWMAWMNSMPQLTKVALNRCITPKDFGPTVSCQLHNLCDANEVRYGSVSYTRLCNAGGDVHCEFLFGKAHVTPMTAVTVPRLELQAAVTAGKISNIMLKTLTMPVDKVVSGLIGPQY